MDDEKKITQHLISVEGEINSDIYEGDYVRIIRKNSVDASRTKKIRELEAIKSGDKQEWNLEHFFKGHIPEIRELMKSLSIYDRAFLFSIATYVGYEDCCLKFDNGKCLDFEDLVTICGMSRSKLSEVINALRSADIIYKGINSKGIQYFVNPWIYCKGVRINAVLKTMFRNYHVRVLGGQLWGQTADNPMIEKIKQITSGGNT